MLQASRETPQKDMKEQGHEEQTEEDAVPSTRVSHWWNWKCGEERARKHTGSGPRHLEVATKTRDTSMFKG